MKKVIFFLLFSSPILAQQPEPQFSIHLEVAGDEHSVASSYFRRELRSLGDVTFVDDPTEADFWLSVVIVQNQLKGDERDVGYSISLVVLEDDSTLENLFEGEDKKLIEVWETFDLAAHWLWTSGMGNFRQRIFEMVAKFDSDYLERRR